MRAGPLTLNASLKTVATPPRKCATMKLMMGLAAIFIKALKKGKICLKITHS